jgi:hypothetical protein
MSPRRIDVFYYGLFMDADLLREHGLQPDNPRLARLDDYALVIADRAALVLRPGAQVYGVVMDLTQAELTQLYAEPSVADYRPEPVLLHMDVGDTIAALCYNLELEEEGTETNRLYASKLHALAGRLGLPESYQEVLRGMAGSGSV